MDFDNYIEQERIKAEERKPVIHTCDECGADIFAGQEFYSIEGFNLCEECFDELQSNEKMQHRFVAGDEVWED